ncbi:PREDICTED: uncharacterized protein LOC108763236 [Trachymyrmex cornetzi]|uniref:uncharacterized protein LOC108763236 n=1 Tax=Trachymyrmex cornetzi TaxID=471704 RepID=UPI00084EF052|nr:PREDICTED: uncharacterized protein LOC108763236 [Trachymyrmex cornetzi]
MCHALENNIISIPQARPIPNTNIILPFCMVGDEDFPLKTYLMRPYAKQNLLGNEQKVFNYRLSRARRIVENAFGILTSRWRILRTSISLKVDTAETIIQAVTCLHNFIITTASNNNLYIQPSIADREELNGDIIPGNWRNLATNNECMINFGRVGANIGAVTAMRQRDILARYFM